MARMPPDFLLARAAEEVMARVRADGERVDYPGRSLFEYLETHLFDIDLNVSSWCRACRIWKGTALYRVQATIGTTLGCYLEELRVETAMRLMVISEGTLPCSEVGFQVGYAREVVFRRVFEQRAGLRPAVYRKQVLSLRKLGRRPPDPIWVRTGWLAQLGEERFEPAVALAAVVEIEAACGLGPSGSVGFGSRLDYERWSMARWWPRLRTLSGSALLSWLARGFELETPALVELLLRQVAVEVERRPQRAVDLAQLAVFEVLKLGRHLGSAELSHLLARGWAWLGHAHRSAGDLFGAARVFRQAEGCLASHPAPPAIAAEVQRLQSGLTVRVWERPDVQLTAGARGGLAGGVWIRPDVQLAARGGMAGGVWERPDVQLAARAGAAVRIWIGDEVRPPAGARGGMAVGLWIRPDVQLAARHAIDHTIEPGGEGLPNRAEARWRVGVGAGKDRGGDAGEQHEEAKAGEEAGKAVARHGVSSLQAGSEPANMADLACSDPEASPSTDPNRKPAALPGSAPCCGAPLERLVAAELEAMAYRVRRDAVVAPEGWEPVFDQLEQRLFDPQLRVKPLRKAHRLAFLEATREFEKIFGCEPGEYVTRRRIDTVNALLGIEGLTVWGCAERVGFISPSGFEDAYKRLCGETPTETRTRLAAAGKMVKPESAAKSEEALRRLLALQEPTATIAEICRALRERSRAVLRERAESVESWEQLWIDEWWAQVRELPITELWLLREGRLETAAAFEKLWRASREEGRVDRQRGVEIAEITFESLGLLHGKLAPSGLAELEAKALAELGNAYRLVLDFSAAKQAFAAAEQCLEGLSTAVPQLRSEALWLKACLYDDEGRFEEALALTQRALVLASVSPRLQAEILLRQGSICDQLGRMPEAIANFDEAFGLLSPAEEPYLAWIATHSLAIAWYRVGDATAARGWLERAEPIVRTLGQARPLCWRDWLVGLLAANQGDLEQAELHLRRAHAGYERLKDLAHGGVISLDLAALYLRLDRPVEAAQLASEALPQLGSLGLASEGIVALRLLHQALESKTLETAVLERVRGCIARMVNAPELEPAARQEAPPPAS